MYLAHVLRDVCVEPGGHFNTFFPVCHIIFNYFSLRGHTADQHHTGLRHVEVVDNIYIYWGTHRMNIILS